MQWWQVGESWSHRYYLTYSNVITTISWLHCQNNWIFSWITSVVKIHEFLTLTVFLSRNQATVRWCHPHHFSWWVTSTWLKFIYHDQNSESTNIAVSLQQLQLMNTIATSLSCILYCLPPLTITNTLFVQDHLRTGRMNLNSLWWVIYHKPVTVTHWLALATHKLQSPRHCNCGSYPMYISKTEELLSHLIIRPCLDALIIR